MEVFFLCMKLLRMLTGVSHYVKLTQRAPWRGRQRRRRSGGPRRPRQHHVAQAWSGVHAGHHRFGRLGEGGRSRRASALCLCNRCTLDDLSLTPTRARLHWCARTWPASPRTRTSAPRRAGAPRRPAPARPAPRPTRPRRARRAAAARRTLARPASAPRPPWRTWRGPFWAAATAPARWCRPPSRRTCSPRWTIGA